MARIVPWSLGFGIVAAAPPICVPTLCQGETIFETLWPIEWSRLFSTDSVACMLQTIVQCDDAVRNDVLPLLEWTACSLLVQALLAPLPLPYPIVNTIVSKTNEHTTGSPTGNVLCVEAVFRLLHQVVPPPTPNTAGLRALPS